MCSDNCTYFSDIRNCLKSSQILELANCGSVYICDSEMQYYGRDQSQKHGAGAGQNVCSTGISFLLNPELPELPQLPHSLTPTGVRARARLLPRSTPRTHCRILGQHPSSPRPFRTIRRMEADAGAYNCDGGVAGRKVCQRLALPRSQPTVELQSRRSARVLLRPPSHFSVAFTWLENVDALRVLSALYLMLE
jgi:hypothetical protein